MSTPVPRDVPTETASNNAAIRGLDGLTHVTSILIGLATLTSVALSWSFWSSYATVTGYTQPGSTSVADLRTLLQLNTIVSWVDFGMQGAVAIAFIAWLWRARRNAEVLSDYRHRRGKGWVIGGWFCPIVNLAFPPIIVNDVYWASNSAGPPGHSLNRPGNGLVGWWWAAWLTSCILNRYIAQTDGSSVDSLHTIAVTQSVVAVTTICSAVLIVLVMRRLTALQNLCDAEVTA